jgi:hypothetical protein
MSRDHGRVVAGTIAAMILAAFAVFSARSVTHGFVAYYAASRLLVTGQLGPPAYDDAWFGEVVRQLTESNVREIFTPNPPTMALMALPIAWLDAQPARAVWLIASVFAFLAGVAALVRQQARRNRDVAVPVLLLMLLAPAVFSNLRVGQGYLFVFALFATAIVLLGRRREGLAGVALGFLLGLKTSGTAFVAVLLVQRRWRALMVAAACAGLLALAVTPFIDASMWWMFPGVVRDFVQRPSGSVTAYQTTLSLFRHLCIADPAWNPAPAASCGPIAVVIPSALLATALAVTLYLVHRAPANPAGLAAGATLSLLALPTSAEVHFVLLAIPLAMIRLRPVEFLVIAALLIVPLEWTAERYTAGSAAILAYPRLYAAWLLWAACLRELKRSKDTD